MSPDGIVEPVDVSGDGVLGLLAGPPIWRLSYRDSAFALDECRALAAG